MAVIVPNATSTAGGNRFAVIGQSEPDSIDIEILGNVGNSGVLYGCAVSPSASPLTRVSVSSGVVVVGGRSYEFTGGEAVLQSAPANKCFELVLLRVSGDVVTLVTIQGNDAESGIRYPQSTSTLPSTVPFNPAAHVNFETDVVLAALFRNESSSVLNPNIVDKRALIKSNVPLQGTAPPDQTLGQVGDLYYRTSTFGSLNSGVYIKSLRGWIELASVSGTPNEESPGGGFLPIGSMVAWPSREIIPAGYVEANGQALNATTYAELFSVYRYTHGGAGNTFNVPNYNNFTVRGTTTPSAVGTIVGSDSVLITVDQLPSHNHNIGEHTHNFAHTHNMDHSHSSNLSPAADHSHSMSHGHDGSTSSFSGAHSHTISVATANPSHTHLKRTDSESYLYRLDTYVGAGRRLEASATGDVAVSWRANTGTSDSGLAHSHSASASTSGAHAHSFTVSNFNGSTGFGGGHTHTLTVSNFNGSTGQASVSTTSSSSGVTSNTGSNEPINNIPRSRLTRWIIRAL